MHMYLFKHLPVVYGVSGPGLSAGWRQLPNRGGQLPRWAPSLGFVGVFASLVVAHSADSAVLAGEDVTHVGVGTALACCTATAVPLLTNGFPILHFACAAACTAGLAFLALGAFALTLALLWLLAG